MLRLSKLRRLANCQATGWHRLLSNLLPHVSVGWHHFVTSREQADALFAAVGFEAWASGSQLIAVTAAG